MRPFPAFIGPICPPMILWQLQGENGWPFHHPGGPLPGLLTWVPGEQLPLSPFDDARAHGEAV